MHSLNERAPETLMRELGRGRETRSSALLQDDNTGEWDLWACGECEAERKVPRLRPGDRVREI